MFLPGVGEIQGCAWSLVMGMWKAQSQPNCSSPANSHESAPQSLKKIDWGFVSRQSGVSSLGFSPGNWAVWRFLKPLQGDVAILARDLSGRIWSSSALSAQKKDTLSIHRQAPLSFFTILMWEAVNYEFAIDFSITALALLLMPSARVEGTLKAFILNPTS